MLPQPLQWVQPFEQAGLRVGTWAKGHHHHRDGGVELDSGQGRAGVGSFHVVKVEM